MECELCQTPGRKNFYCEVCLNERLLIHKNALQRLRASLDTRVQNAAENLDAPGGVRERRNLKAQRDTLISNIKSLEARQKSSADQLQSNTSIVSNKRKELAIRKTKLQAARSRLQDQQSHIPTPSSKSKSHSRATPCLEKHNQILNLTQKIASVQEDWDRILENLSIIRRKLIIQLCSIYPITVNYVTPQSNNNLMNPTQIQQSQLQQPPRSRHQERDPKLSSNSKINPKLSWRILGLSLPVSTEIKSYHHEHTSAATLYASHLVRLIALYLGIKLPFQMIMGPFLSIRAPFNSIWASKHPSPYPLHIPSSISSMVYSSGSQVSQIAYLSGLCMLAINAEYLLLTQQPEWLEGGERRPREEKAPLPDTRGPSTGREDPASADPKPTELLRNLYTLCRTRPIGCRSHLTGKHPLHRPDHPCNPAKIDLDGLVRAVLQSKIDDSVDEGWSII